MVNNFSKNLGNTGRVYSADTWNTKPTGKADVSHDPNGTRRERRAKKGRKKGSSEASD